MCCFHAVSVLTVRGGAPSLCSLCVTVFLQTPHCVHGASRCSYKITRPIGTGWLTQVQAIQAVIVLTVLRHCARGASRCSFQTVIVLAVRRGAPTSSLTQVRAIQAIIVLTVRHGAVTSSPAPSAQGGSGKVRQTRRRVDLHKQARVRISKLSKPQRR